MTTETTSEHLKENCLTCQDEPDWHGRRGKCKRFKRAGLSENDTHWFYLYRNPDEVICNGRPVVVCPCWKPKDSSSKPKNKKYIVLVREVHISPVEIEAKNADEAIDLVREGEGETIYEALEYSHTMDFDTWTVEEVRSTYEP